MAKAFSGIDNLREQYQEALVVLAQCLDLPGQRPLLAKLITGLRGVSSPAQDDRRKAFDGLRRQYWHGLMTDSASVILNEVRGSQAAQNRFRLGAAGGAERSYSANDENEIWGSIHNLDDRLYNLPLLIATFGINVNNVQLRSKYFTTKAMTKVFESQGLGVESPQFRLALLCQMELNAKRLAVIPVLSEALRLLKQDETNQVQGIETIYTDPVQFKRKGLEKVMLGRTGRFMEERERLYQLKSTYQPSDQGTEFWRGLFTTVAGNLRELAAQTYGSQDAGEAVDAIKLLVFMRISQRRQDQAPAELWEKILIPIKEGHIQEVAEVARDLIRDNPNLYSETTWLRLGLDPEMLLERQAQLLEEPKQQIVGRKLTEEEKAERKKVMRQASTEKWKQRRSEELWPEMEPYIGQMGIRIDSGFVKIEERALMKPRGLDLPKERGFVSVKYYQRNTEGKLADAGHAVMSYATALENIKQGLWAFPKS